MPTNPNSAQVIHLFADIQNHLHDGTFRHELSQIARHTKDREIIDICNRAAECLEIEINTNFHDLNPKKYIQSLRTLINHLKWAKERFDKIVVLMPDLNPKWTESIFRATEIQLLDLSNHITLLDREHDIHDGNDEVVKIGDLVAAHCKDENNKDYDHYGIVIPSSKGFRVAHFFTGATVKTQNSLVEKGFGYIHEVPYSPEWFVQTHIPESITYSQIEGRIRESRKLNRRVWNKMSYNCEHWAREMLTGEPECTQLTKWKDEIRERRKQAKDTSEELMQKQYSLTEPEQHQEIGLEILKRESNLNLLPSSNSNFILNDEVTFVKLDRQEANH
jgi:hypothetical protein